MKHTIFALCTLLSLSSVIKTSNYYSEIPYELTTEEEFEEKTTTIQCQDREVRHITNKGEILRSPYLRLDIPLKNETMIEAILLLQEEVNSNTRNQSERIKIMPDNLREYILNDSEFQNAFFKHPKLEQRIVELIKKEKEQITKTTSESK